MAIKQKTRTELQREIMELKAQSPYACHAASGNIQKAGEPHMSASAVILQLTALGGRAIIDPVAIRNGLSRATIEAIHADLVRSFELATLYKVQPLKEPVK